MNVGAQAGGATANGIAPTQITGGWVQRKPVQSLQTLFLSLARPLARPLVFRSSPVKRARRVCPGRLCWLAQ